MISTLSVFALLFCCAFSIPHNEGRLKYQATVRNLAAKVRMSGCKVNVCFAIDTSGSVSDEDFVKQREFIIDITAIIGADSRSRFAAGQYGKRTYRISSLTSDVSAFNGLVQSAQLQKDGATSMGSGIVWCDRQLRRQKDDANKMVVMGDGNNNLGGDPVHRANIFRERANGRVCTVGVGFEDQQDIKVLEEVAGSPARLFAVDDYVELSFIVEELVEDICKFSLEL